MPSEPLPASVLFGLGCVVGSLVHAYSPSVLDLLAMAVAAKVTKAAAAPKTIAHIGTKMNASAAVDDAVAVPPRSKCHDTWNASENAKVTNAPTSIQTG